MIYQNKQNKSYYYKFSLNGRQYLKRGFTSKKKALTAEKQFKDELLGIDKSGYHRLNLTYSQGLNEFKDFYFKSQKETTAKEIARAINSYYINYFKADRLIYQLNASDAEKAWSKINSEAISPATKNKKLAFLKRFFLFIQKKYSFYYSSIFNLPKFKDYKISRVKKKKLIIELSDLQQLIQKANSKYMKLAILTLFIYGYRLGELLGLKVNSFDFKNKTVENYINITFKTGDGGFIEVSPKTKKSDRLRSCSDEYLNLVKEHIKLNNLKSNDFIFFSLANQFHEDIHNKPIHENTFRRMLQRLNPDITPHTLRRSLVTHLTERGVSIKEISKYIGHESIRTTESYYLKQSDEKAKKINNVIDQIINDLERNDHEINI